MSNMFPFTPEGEELVAEMRLMRLDSLEESFRQVVYGETEALLSIPPQARRTTARWRQARKDGEDNVVNLIQMFLKDPDYVMGPQDILSYRCKASAWAIARLLMEARKEAL